MPRQKLVDSSTLLNQHGWLKLRGSACEYNAVGVDRSGQLTNRVVTARLIGDTNLFAFVGSKSAFGVFHSDTRLVDADGEVRTVDEIVLENMIGTLHFENVTTIENLVLRKREALNLWSELRKVAVVEDEEHIVLLAGGLQDRFKRDWCKVFSPAPLAYADARQPAYLGVRKAKFLETITANPNEVLQELITSMFQTTQEGAIVVERDDFIWCLWMLLFTDQQKAAELELTFDSLQHSTTVSIAPKTSKSSRILSRGATAFFRNQDVGIFEISWDDPSWSPISSGFILSAA